MNRHARRAAASRARSYSGRVILIHEAGHACGRILAAPDFELQPEAMIESIEIGPGYVMNKGDLFMDVFSQAVTYGPLLSDPLQIAVGPAQTVRTVSSSISKAKTEGVNVDKWLRGQLHIVTMGPAAEAKYSGTPLETIWTSASSACDRADAVRACVTYAGLSYAQADKRILEALARAKTSVDDDTVFQAIRVLADKLPASGKMLGCAAARILLEALAA